MRSPKIPGPSTEKILSFKKTGQLLPTGLADSNICRHTGPFFDPIEVLIHTFIVFAATKPEKEVISLCVDAERLRNIDSKATAIGISRNELINQMILCAMDNMVDTEEETL